MCQGQADPILKDRVVDVLKNLGFEGAKRKFLHAPFEGFARTAAEHGSDIPFDNAATIEMGLSIIMQRWYDEEINSDKVDMGGYVKFMFNSVSLEQQANNSTRRLLVQLTNEQQ